MSRRLEQEYGKNMGNSAGDSMAQDSRGCLVSLVSYVIEERNAVLCCPTTREREEGREMNGWTDRQTERHTQKDGDRQTERVLSWSSDLLGMNSLALPGSSQRMCSLKQNKEHKVFKPSNVCNREGGREGERERVLLYYCCIDSLELVKLASW